MEKDIKCELIWVKSRINEQIRHPSPWSHELLNLVMQSNPFRQDKIAILPSHFPVVHRHNSCDKNSSPMNPDPFKYVPPYPKSDNPRPRIVAGELWLVICGWWKKPPAPRSGFAYDLTNSSIKPRPPARSKCTVHHGRW